MNWQAHGLPPVGCPQLVAPSWLKQLVEAGSVSRIRLRQGKRAARYHSPSAPNRWRAAAPKAAPAALICSTASALDSPAQFLAAAITV